MDTKKRAWQQFLIASLKVSILLGLLSITWVVAVLHSSTLSSKRFSHLSGNSIDTNNHGEFFEKNAQNLNHLIVRGSPFERGLTAGRLTAAMMATTEELLFTHFERFFSQPILRWTFVIAAMRWFHGSDHYFSPTEIEELYGISLASNHRYDYYLDPATLTLAFHGIHEVGQSMVDFARSDFACTIVGLHNQDGWVIGRNFDFSIGRFFDRNKILKWYFPSEGNAFLSVSWPGMLGSVTGVNQHGVYISINAGGTKDFRRLGTPSTLVVNRALMQAADAQEAVAIIQGATVFVADLYTVSDGRESFVVEKTPKRSFIFQKTNNFSVTNHFVSKQFVDDPINAFRRDHLRSLTRLKRAEERIELTDTAPMSSLQMSERTLSILRDRNGFHNQKLPLASPDAIDALIASHSVIYDTISQVLYVSQGPGLSGKYFGYDLRASFREQTPVKLGELKEEGDQDVEAYFATHAD